jgi:MFS family permease
MSGAPRPSPRRTGVSAGVVLLGLVSLLTDVSSESIFSVLPVYFTVVLGGSTVLLGLMEGLADFAGSSLDLASGFVSDRTGRRKWLATLGYAVSSVSKVLLVLVTSAAGVVGFRVVERLGKSIRGAPRDALLSTLASQADRGLAFGIHKALDKAGAVVGPLVAWLVLDRLGQTEQGFRTLFLIALVPAFLAVLLLSVSVPERRAPPRERLALRAALASLGPRYRHYLAAAALFSLGYASFAFLMLKASAVGFETSEVALLYALFNGTFALVAIPIGKIGDRLGRRGLIVLSYAIHAALSVGLALLTTRAGIAAMFVVYGVFYAIDEAQTRAYLADLSSAATRATAMGVYGFVTGLVFLPASLIAGALWKVAGAPATFGFAAGVSVAALAFFLAFGPDSRRPAARTALRR